MFTKKPDKEYPNDEPRMAADSMPQPARTMNRRPAGKSGHSLIGADLTVVGHLLSQGEIHIDGEIQGDVHAVMIVIGESATITGSLVADEIVIRGTVMGSIRGKRVALQSSSKVEGDIYHSQLAIEQGAFFEGKSRRMEDPTAGVQRPEIPLPSGREPV